MLGNVASNGIDFTGTPVDVTSDVMAAIVDKFGTAETHVITVNGHPKYEIKITDVSAKDSAEKYQPLHIPV